MLTSCVLEKFQERPVPPPEGPGCAEVNVPLRFEPQRSPPDVAPDAAP
jgi:hypothetical protein